MQVVLNPLSEHKHFSSGTGFAFHDGGNERVPFFVFDLGVDDVGVFPDGDVTFEGDELDGRLRLGEVCVDEDGSVEEAERGSLSVGTAGCCGKAIKVFWAE